MRRLGLIALFSMLAFPAYGDPYRLPYPGRCYHTPQEYDCRANAFAKFHTCLLKSEQRYLKDVNHIGYNSPTQVLFRSRVAMCIEDYHTLTGVYPMGFTDQFISDVYAQLQMLLIVPRQ